MGCHSLLRGSFPTHGSNPGLLHCRRILCCLSHQGSPPHYRCPQILLGSYSLSVMASHLKICQWIRHPHPWLQETHTQVGKWRGWGNEKVSEYRAQSVKSANEKKSLGEGNGDGNIYHSKARMLVLMLHLFFFFFGSLLPRAIWLGGDGTFIWIQSKMLNYSALMSVILALSLVL